jgi:hypothetical protein
MGPIRAVDKPAAASAPAPELVELPLTVPLDDRGAELTVLRLRPLRPDDLERVGDLPFTMRGDGGVQINPAVMSALIARLANVSREAVGRMAMPDWWEAVKATLGFLGLAVPTS